MHGNKHADLEALDKLSAAKGIAITYAPVNGENCHIEAIGNLTDVLQFAQILLFVGLSFFSTPPITPLGSSQ